MERIIIVLFIVFTTFVNIGCKEAPEKIAKRIEQHDNRLERLAKFRLRYFKDEDTGICFAFGYICKHHKSGGPMLAQVPCSEKVMEKIKKKGEYSPSPQKNSSF